MNLSDHEIRVVQEASQLQVKLQALYVFTTGKVFKTLSARDQKLLELQLAAMNQYYSILEERISLFKGA